MICPKCQREVASFHNRSHVLPDWMDKQNRTNENKLIHIDIENLTASKQQTGYHGQFWCEQCEQRSGKDDDYGSLVLTNTSPNSAVGSKITKKTLIKGDDKIQGIELWQGFDFKRFQNFVFICVIRGELFRRTQGKSILNQKHFQKICDFYDDPNLIDDTTYPIVVSKSPPTDPDKQIGYLPYNTQLGQCTGVMFRGGTFQFQIFIEGDVVSQTHTIRLEKSGTMPLFLDYLKNTGPYKSSMAPLTKIIKNHPSEKFSRKKKTPN